MPFKVEIENLPDEFLYGLLEKEGNLKERVHLAVGDNPTMPQVVAYIREHYETITMRGDHAIVERKGPT